MHTADIAKTNETLYHSIIQHYHQ